MLCSLVEGSAFFGTTPEVNAGVLVCICCTLLFSDITVVIAVEAGAILDTIIAADATVVVGVMQIFVDANLIELLAATC